MSRVDYRCPKCNGDHCGYDAVAVWDSDAQDWVLGSMYDSMWCNDCGEISELTEIDLDADEIKTDD